MTRTTWKHLEELTHTFARLTGRTDLEISRWQADTGERVLYRLEAGGGSHMPYGHRWRTAGEMADALRFAIAVLSEERDK